MHELLGPHDLTYTEATSILGERIGKPDLQYVQLSDADMVGALTQGGMSESFARLYVEMTRAFANGTVVPRKGRNAVNTTRNALRGFCWGVGERVQGDVTNLDGGDGYCETTFTATAIGKRMFTIDVTLPDSLRQSDAVPSLRWLRVRKRICA